MHLRELLHFSPTTVSTPASTFRFPLTLCNPYAEVQARLLDDVHRDLSVELTLTGERYKEQVDRHR